MMCTSRVVSTSVLWGLLLCLAAVGAQPRIEIAPQTTTVVAGRTAILYCKVVNKGMYTVTWIKNNKIISNDGSIISTAVPSTRYSIVGDPIQGNYDLMITEVFTTENNVPFRCKLRAPPSGGEDIVSESAYLIVQHPPGEGCPQCSPDNRSTTGLQVGQQVNFSCSTERGEPAARLNWTLDETEVPAQLTESPGYIKLNFAINVDVEDDGKSFICTLTHELMPELRACEVGPFDVVYPPVETTISATPLVPKEGGTLVLVCGATANPISDIYTWYITPPSPEIGDSQASREDRPGATGSLWVLRDVAYEDEGTVVVCEARNGLGALNASFTIDVFKQTTPPPRPTPPLVVPTKAPPPATPEPKSGDSLITAPYVIILILIAAALLLLTIALVIFVVKRKKRPTQAVITVTDLDNIHADVHSLASFGGISRTGTPYLDRVDYELNRSRSHSRDMFDSVSLDSASINRSHSRDSPTHRKYSVDSLGKPLRHDHGHHEYRSPSNGSPTHRPAKRLDSSPIKERKPSDSAHSQAGRPLPKIAEPIQQNEYAELTPISARKRYNESLTFSSNP
ncbi:cell adhesion molecule 3-like [Patiria miniata]|uniref:Ig-like domain-containing protein n=1 Tax=Patiria miniata TaxID=46514 RepID=A0A913Z912_PATMI|nr:cell adhesion molecule 3-like [Patiria miniata]